MSKLILETTGAFQLIEGMTGQQISFDKPHVVPETSFVRQRIGFGQIRVLGEVSDDATDKDFQQAVKDARGKDNKVLTGADYDKVVASFAKDFKVADARNIEKSKKNVDETDAADEKSPLAPKDPKDAGKSTQNETGKDATGSAADKK